MLLLFAGNGFAAVLACEKAAPAIVGAITFTKATYESACAVFVWSHSQVATDFNNYVVRATGGKTVADFNTTAKSLTICTIEPGTSETIYVRAYDGNASDNYCSFDYNNTVSSGSIYGAGKYMVYNIFIIFAAIIGIIIFIGAVLILIRKFPGMIPKIGK
jgi:hypothetical protein